MSKLFYNTVLILTVLTLSVEAQSIPGKKQFKPALLVIDIQNAYLPYMCKEDKQFALEIINEAIDLFRQHGYPIIRIYHTDIEGGPKPGTEPFEYPSSVKIDSNDIQIIKNYPSAFKKTDLEKILGEKGINTLYLCGLSAVACVLATYHTATDLDFDVFMIKDALLSGKPEYTNLIQEIKPTVNLYSLKLMMDYAQ
ncbi:MAG TPA: isochorismatase family protein [Ignavibacteriaceae bacterium]|nr:isochorismatase family protein [Ignavibacteriaceae bacterium]